ncbi:MAG TPA: hypothetical protein VHV10_04890 [Ktedonobacteraceae bacterium]|jgi:hypothetical protein|nr:hypothetical protein [Ktedonobacteraceae bacterium]
MPLLALEDALHAQVADVVVEQERELAAREAKQLLDEEAGHVEHVQLEEQQKTST